MLIDIYKEVGKIRERQDKIWAEQNHSLEWWMQILMEEVGEASKALLEARFGVKLQNLENYREKLIQVAAVAIAMIQSYDRNRI